jgi:hypothetical protein
MIRDNYTIDFDESYFQFMEERLNRTKLMINDLYKPIHRLFHILFENHVERSMIEDNLKNVDDYIKYILHNVDIYHIEKEQLHQFDKLMSDYSHYNAKYYQLIK